MSAGRLSELIAGVLVAILGLVLLGISYLQPYGDSKQSGPFSFHPGFTSIQVPYLIGFGLLLVGIAVGAILDGLKTSTVALLLLGVSVLLLCALTVLGIASVGLGLLPAAVIGVVALVIAVVRRGLALGR